MYLFSDFSVGLLDYFSGTVEPMIALASILCIAIDDFHDHFLCFVCGLECSDEVDRSEAVHTFILSDDIHVASTAFLEITDCFASTADDQTHSLVWHHYLYAVFAFAQSRLVCLPLSSHWLASGRCFFLWRVAAILINNPIDLAFGINPCARIACDLALPLRTIGFSTELYPGASILFNAS